MPGNGNASPPPDYHALNASPQDNAMNKITLKCTFVDVDNIGGYSWQFVLPLNSCTTWRALCDKLSTCLSLIRDLEGVPYPGETTFWARDMIADGFICKEDWEQLVYGGGKYELIFRSNSRIKPNISGTREAMMSSVGNPMGRAMVASGASPYPAPQPPRFAGGRRTAHPES